MSASALGRRKDRIRLSQRDLVRLTGLDKTTVNHALNGKSDPLASTIARLDGAIAAEETALRDYLLALHPLPEVDEVRGAGAPVAVPLEPVRSAA